MISDKERKMKIFEMNITEIPEFNLLFISL